MSVTDKVEDVVKSENRIKQRSDDTELLSHFQATASSTYRPFRYAPLVDCERPGCPKSIRLLELLPGQPNSIISTRLIDSTLTYHRSHESWYEPRGGYEWPGHRGFAALSYEWGTATSTSTILVNGQALHIRQNLWNFLTQIRRIRSDSLPALLWIDSICINQEDIGEKNSQVQLMHKIYAQAEEVLVWLGDTAHLSTEVFQRLRQQVARAEAGDENFRSKEPIASRTGNVRAIMRNTAQHFKRQSDLAERFFTGDKRLMVALLKVCRRTYWTRAWIIQECLNAKAVTLFCGSESLPHDAFPFVGALCEQLQNSVSAKGALEFNASPFLGSDLANPVNRDANDAANRVVELTNRWHIGRHSGLESLLQSYHGSACSNLHDKVYAFLGLSTEGDEFPVDYGVSLHTLLAQTVVFCNASKKRRQYTSVDPIRRTCDSVCVAQLLVEDLKILDGYDSVSMRTVPRHLLDETVTMELDYLGSITCFLEQADSKTQSGIHDQPLFELNMHKYMFLSPSSIGYGDRVFALRGTPLVLVYRRTLTRLHFVGYAILSDTSSIDEQLSLLAADSSLESIGNDLDSDDNIRHATASAIVSFPLPAPDPIPRYSLQYGRSFVVELFRRIIISHLPDVFQRSLMTQNADSTFFASPSVRVRLELVLEVVRIWPKRVRTYKDYCKDLNSLENSSKRTVLARVWHSVLDIVVRVRNSILTDLRRMT